MPLPAGTRALRGGRLPARRLPRPAAARPHGLLPDLPHRVSLADLVADRVADRAAAPASATTSSPSASSRSWPRQPSATTDGGAPPSSSPTSTAVTSPTASCPGGHGHGTSWRIADCTSCRCEAGRTECFEQRCPPLQCELQFTPRGMCCPVCLGECRRAPVASARGRQGRQSAPHVCAVWSRLPTLRAPSHPSDLLNPLHLVHEVDREYICFQRVCSDLPR